MNKNLLKKIQADIGVSAGNYCGCFTEYQMAVIEKVYNGVPNKIDFESLPKDFCGKCRKPVNTEFIDDFNRQLEMILPAYSVEEVVSESAVIEGVLPLEAARQLGITLEDVNRHVKSGRLNLDASGKFVTQDSFDELKTLIRQRNEPSES
jgi:hypothetical protein